MLGPSTLDPVQAATPLLRRSFDDLTPCHHRHRTTPQQEQLADEISQNLDGLDLSGLPSKPSSGKKVGPVLVWCCPWLIFDGLSVQLEISTIARLCVEPAG